MAGVGGAVGESPWIISKNYDAWGPTAPSDASRKRDVRPPPLAARGRPVPRRIPVAPGKSGAARGMGASGVARSNNKADNSSVVDALMPLILLMQIGIAMPVQRKRDGAYPAGSHVLQILLVLLLQIMG